MPEVIQIESFNPYEGRFPNRKTISLETVILIKHLKREGYTVKVLPDDDRPIEYIFKKGVRELLQDPITLFAVGIPMSIVLNIISNYIQRLIDRGKNGSPTINVKNLVIRHENVYMNHLGDQLKKREVKNIEIMSEKLKKAFGREFLKHSPYAERPVPIFYEHRPRIVGWCMPRIDEIGLKIENGIVLDKEIKRKIKKNKIKGLSVTGIASQTSCSICNSNFIECDHFAGEMYNGSICVNNIVRGSFVEVSLVKTPINSECLIDLMN